MQIAPNEIPGGGLLRVLTYNVHSCRGRDRRHDPARIAEVIASADPQVIALQELDVGRIRTGGIDQAHMIAEHLRMDAHFHPALHVDEEKYGDAILTALPSRVVRAAALPSVGEPRGAIWVEVDYHGAKVQIINTHFGLWRRERMLQARTLAADEWLGSEACRISPSLLAGDFNAGPRSRTYTILAEGLSKRVLTIPARPTFPARFPVLRLDHIFANALARIIGYEVVDTPLARQASDHLPLLATVELRAVERAATTRSEPENAETMTAHG
ncbi:endonuclease/exonuclease/phosphatase family protein [Rhizobium sp. TH2]|uniref:endonuclease/exonuclease/phosphatase family protein n=1 Tax=Rhizobium sp. TH2 TaxID=2775403 RepID=UPI00215871DF|nr:endonuclease/exonuclease/phosphatase family protein [Rhizobium sp. TH2]UVC06578.1 endonuclease/exonuclease/phosphatase family protein [Rhizobium sp. TH2]